MGEDAHATSGRHRARLYGTQRARNYNAPGHPLAVSRSPFLQSSTTFIQDLHTPLSTGPPRRYTPPSEVHLFYPIVRRFFRLLLPTALGVVCLAGAFTGCRASPKAVAPGQFLQRAGDEIVVCGQLVHTGAPVVLWMDPGGYDAYREIGRAHV